MRLTTGTLTIAATAALALTLTACGDASDDAPAVPASPTAEAEPTTEATAEEGATESAPPETETGEEGADDGAVTADGQTAAAIAALDLAASEVGGIAYELDDEDGQYWEIDVSLDGADHEVRVSWDGTEVISSRPDGSVDNDDVSRLAEATVTIQQAAATASAEVDGDVTDIDLTTENGEVAWEVDLDVDGSDVEVYVSAISGEVIKVDRD